MLISDIHPFLGKSWQKQSVGAHWTVWQRGVGPNRDFWVQNLHISSGIFLYFHCHFSKFFLYQDILEKSSTQPKIFWHQSWQERTRGRSLEICVALRIQNSGESSHFSGRTCLKPPYASKTNRFPPRNNIATNIEGKQTGFRGKTTNCTVFTVLCLLYVGFCQVLYVCFLHMEWWESYGLHWSSLQNHISQIERWYVKVQKRWW